MKTLLDTVDTWLRDAEFTFDRIDDPPCFRLPFVSGAEAWTCVVRICEDPHFVAVYGGYPFEAPAERRIEVAMLMTRINFGLVIGKMELDLDDGEMHCMAGLDLDGVELQRRALLNIVEHVAETTDHYYAAIAEAAGHSRAKSRRD